VSVLFPPSELLQAKRGPGLRTQNDLLFSSFCFGAELARQTIRRKKVWWNGSLPGRQPRRLALDRYHGALRASGKVNLLLTRTEVSIQENIDMTPLHTDDDQLRRLDEMVRALHESLIVANEARHDKAAKAHYLQRLETQARRVLAELNSSSQPASDGANNVFDLGDLK